MLFSPGKDHTRDWNHMVAMTVLWDGALRQSVYRWDMTSLQTACQRTPRRHLALARTEEIICFA